MSQPIVQAQASYDRLSRWYDLLAGRAEGELRALGLRLLAADAGETVLEIGFGTGQVLAELAPRPGISRRVVGVDLSRGMCRVARARLARAGLPDKALLVQGDAIRLPIAPGVVDAVFMSFALELFDTDNMAAVLVECRRVLHPQGRLCVVAMAEATRPNLMTRAYAWAHHRFPALVDCRPIALQPILAAEGFHIATAIRRSLWGLPVEALLAQLPQNP